MATRRTLALALLLGLALLGIRATPARAQEQVTLQFTNSATDPQTRAINAWIDQASATTNHSTDVDLHVGTGGIDFTNHNHRAVVQFDISRIPRAGIKSASLQMFLDTVPHSFGAPLSRNWEVHQITSFVGFANASSVTWNNRTSQLAWTVGGGDIGGAVGPATPTNTTAGVTLTWNVLSAVQTYFGVKVGLNAGPPDPNFGFIIKDQREDLDHLGTSVVEGTLASNSTTEIPLNTHAPALVVNVIQQVHNLTATPGSNSVTLNWTYPSQITGSTIVNATTGVVIVRNTNGPIPASALIVDGTAPPAVCGTVNATSAILVANLGTGTPTTFTDSGGACAPANGNTYFYKVFAVASLGGGNYNYSTNGTGAIGGNLVDNDFVTEIAATPGATAAAQQAPKWIAPVDTATLSAPGIDPGNYAIIATNNNLVQGFSPTTGDDAIAPVSVGGTVTTRMPVLESTESDWGTFNNGGVGLPMTFLAAGDNLLYDVSLNSSGFVKQFSNPLPIFGAYTGGAAMQVKAFSNSGNTKPNDAIMMGTHVAGASPTVNTIFAADDCNLSVTTPTGAGCPGATGGWNIVGGTVTSTGCSTTSTAAACNIDIVTSTPFVDYNRNSVWVTSHNGNTSGQVASPDVWKLDANSGVVLAAVNVGGDIDSSPTGSQDQSVIFVGTNGGVLFAYDPANSDTGPPVTPHQLGTPSTSLSDGAIKGFPLVASSSAPWEVIVSTNTKVTRYDFDGAVFTQRWSTTVSSPSSPITGPNLTDASSNPVILVGGSDGKLHQLRVGDGVDEAQRIVDPLGGTVVVGDPSLDVVDNEVIVGASDGRVYAFSLPF